MLDIPTPTLVEQRFCKVRCPVTFGEQLPADADDVGEVEIVPLDRAVVDAIKRGVKARTEIDDRCRGVFRDVTADFVVELHCSRNNA